MAKASGTTRTKYPSSNQPGQQRKGEAIKLDFTAKASSPMGKIGKNEFVKLNNEIEKILNDAKINTSKASMFVNDYGFHLESEGFVLDRTYLALSGMMDHNYFEIRNPNARGKGVSKAIHRALMPLYEKLGVNGIEVYAALDNGGYTWAQYGFRTSRREVSNLILNQIPRQYINNATKIVQDYYKKHDQSEMFPMHLISSQPWGKDALTGTYWSGKIDFNDDEQKDYFTNYIGYTKPVQSSGRSRRVNSGRATRRTSS